MVICQGHVADIRVSFQWPPCRVCKPYKTWGLDCQICVSSGFLGFSCPWLGQFFSARRVCAQHGSSMGAVGGLQCSRVVTTQLDVLLLLLLLLVLDDDDDDDDDDGDGDGDGDDDNDGDGDGTVKTVVNSFRFRKTS